MINMTFNNKILTIAAIVLLAACAPKTGEKTKTTASIQETGKAPKIEVPTGNVRQKAPKAGTAPALQIGKAETFQLDNGLKVILVENHKLPRIACRIFVDYNPATEKDAAGYVDLMGELLSKGTTKRTKDQIDEEVDFIGANLSTGPNSVNASGLSKHTDKLMDIMSDVLLNPAFSAEEFDKEVKRMESNLVSQKDNANAIIGNVGARLRYGKSHPYGEFTTVSTLKKTTIDLAKNHYETYFKPNISYLVITGDISKSKAEQYAKKYFGKWEKGDAPKAVYAMPRAPEKTQVDFVHKPGAVQSVINITYPVELMPGTEEAIRARLMNTILGGYFNSRVNANLREGHGWTYGARTNLTPDELIGSFTAAAPVRNAVTDSSIIEFMKEMERMRNEKVPAAELQVAKNVLTGQFSRSLEQPGTLADFALNAARYNLPADYYETYLAKLNSTTADDILNIAKKFIQPGKAHIVVVGNRDDVADRLKQFSPEGKINFWTSEGEPAKQINSALPPGITAQQVINDYITAIGGTEKINAIKDLQSTVSMKTRGMEITIKEIKKDGNKLSQEMLMAGQSMGKTVLNGDKAVQSGQGGAMRNVEGAELLELKEQAMAFKEIAYLTTGYTITLKGIEEINGKSAYLIEIIHPGGSKSSDYYDVTSSLKLREVSTAKGPDGSDTTVTNDFDDYKAINGVKFPHSNTTTGIFPVPMKALVSEIKVNAGVEEATFEIK
jgi:zinc protease